MWKWAVACLAWAAGGAGAAGAGWDVEVEMRFSENGVEYAADAGLPLLARLIELPLRDREWVHADEVNAIRDAVAAQLGTLNRFTINGAASAPELARFGIAGEKGADGSYRRKGGIARIEVRHSAAAGLKSVSFDWGLLPEKYFESAAVDDLVDLLEPRDWSALIRLRIGNEPPVELEMRAGQEDYAWERDGEDFSAEDHAGEEGDASADSTRRGRFILLIVLAVLLVLRLAWKEYGERSSRRRG